MSDGVESGEGAGDAHGEWGVADTVMMQVQAAVQQVHPDAEVRFLGDVDALVEDVESSMANMFLYLWERGLVDGATITLIRAGLAQEEAAEAAERLLGAVGEEGAKGRVASLLEGLCQCRKCVAEREGGR